MTIGLNESFLEIFASSIFAKAQGLKRDDLREAEKKRLRESISDDIKKLTNMTPPLVSKAAFDKAKENKIAVKLTAVCWHDQTKFDPGRKIFHWEHMIPVKTLRGACLKAASEQEIAKILKTSKIVWILKTEDKKLTKLGYRSNREDPQAAYKEAGIELVE